LISETKGNGANPYEELRQMTDDDLVFLRASLDVEMRRRGLAFSVGDVGELLAIEHFKKTPGLPNLQATPCGTKNVDAISRRGERYSIKTICKAKKTGTVYPDSTDPNKQLFEYLLIVRLNEAWLLITIYQFTWTEFLQVRSWDARMNAWYVGCSASTLNKGKLIYSAANNTPLSSEPK
jgi:hypothetical protein